MPTILCVMPEQTYRRMHLPEREADVRAMGEVVFCFNAPELSEDAYGNLWASADAVVTGWGVRAPTPAILDRARHLQLICHTAGSVRWLPRQALERGVTVTSAQAGIARSVAEFCLLNALVLLRGKPGAPIVAAGRRTETLYGKTVGLIGFGHVGGLFRGLLVPFGCRVLAFDPHLSMEDAAAHGVERTDMDTLLQSSHIISLHAPDIPATRGMIGARELALICDGSVFLNSARGRLVDTEALTDALAAGVSRRPWMSRSRNRCRQTTRFGVYPMSS